MSLTPDQWKEMEAIFAASFARSAAIEADHLKRTGGIILILQGSPEEPPVNSADFQIELRTFSASLRASGVNASQRAFAMDAADGGGFPLPEFALDLLKTSAAPIAALCGAWLQAKFGRKLKLKIGDIEVEASSEKEIQALLERAKSFQEKTKSDTNLD
jgi:hypothetical protein